MTIHVSMRTGLYRLSVSICLGAMLSALGGCSDDKWGHVTGTVTLQGKPVGPGSMMFEPEDPPTVTTPSAIAHFREDGKYTLKSAGNREGAPVGTYLVMIHGRSEEQFGDEIVDPKAKSAIPS